MGLLVACGPEDTLALGWHTTTAEAASEQDSSTKQTNKETTKAEEKPAASGEVATAEEAAKPEQPGAEAGAGAKAEAAEPRLQHEHNRHRKIAAPAFLLFGLLCVAWGLALVGVSDVAVRQTPEHACMPALMASAKAWWAPSAAAGQPGSSHTAHSSTTHGNNRQRKQQRQTCWAVHVYSLPLLVQDQTPNIGQLWYFFTELFPIYRPFFRQVVSRTGGHVMYTG